MIIRTISATYRREDDGTVSIEVFGRAESGESVTVLHAGFFPYFQVVEPSDRLERALLDLADDRNDPSLKVRSIEPISLWVRDDDGFGVERKCIRVEVVAPWRVPEFRRFLDERDEHPRILAADIPFHHRFWYDLDLGSCIEVEGQEITDSRYTTDLVLRTTVDPIAARPVSPDLTILSFDIETSIASDRVLCICAVVQRGSEILTEERLVDDDEQLLLEAFTAFVRDTDPDLITGYNIDNFDLTRIVERHKALGMRPPLLGRDDREPRRINNQAWRLNGRVVADAWWFARKELRPKQETLHYMAKTYLGAEKNDVDASRMDEEWAARPAEVVEYCLQDARLALELFLMLTALDRSLNLATVARLPLAEVMAGRTSTWIDSLLIRAADREHIGVPLTRREARTSQIAGGYVHDVKPGRYEWILLLDFKSMYPSLIISRNICFTTIAPDGEIAAPDGTRFQSRDRRHGLLPRVVEGLMRDRDEAKARMRSARDPRERELYDGLQEAIKILMNSVYGVFASFFYRFTDRRIGAAITSFARNETQTVIAKLTARPGVSVVYGDTDSVFIASGVTGIEANVALGRELAEEFSVEGATMEFEKVFSSFFSHGAKKRYAGKVVWPEEGMTVRGYEIRRTDSFGLQSAVLERVLSQVLDGDIEAAVEDARAEVDRIRAGAVDPANLVISRSVKELPDADGRSKVYANPESMANVQTALKLRDRGHPFIPGMKVAWIVTDARRTPQQVEPWVSGEDFIGKPDLAYYSQRLASTLARVTEVFGWDENSLLTGQRQRSLFDSFSSPEPASSEESSENKEEEPLLEENLVEEETAEENLNNAEDDEPEPASEPVREPARDPARPTLEDFV